MKIIYITLFALCIALPFARAQKKINVLQSPAGDRYCRIDTAGYSVLPSGRLVRPVGQTVRITRAPFGLAVSPDESKALILHHSGVLTLLDPRDPGKAVRIPGYGQKNADVDNTPFLGVAFAADNQTAYLSGGDSGTVVIFDARAMQKTATIRLDGPFNGVDYMDSFTSDLAIDASRNELFVLDRGNNRMVRIDLATRKITASVPVGRIPFGITLSPDKKTAFVANVGLYNYPLAPGVTPTNKDSQMLKFPAYGIPSKEAQEGVTLPDGKRIPGLGSALADEAMSVWTIDLEKNAVAGRFKTGFQIGEKIEGVEIVGGASPNSVAVGEQFAYVANASNDLISIIDYKKKKIAGEIPLKFDKRLDAFRGLMPFGVALSKDGKTLYAACLGLNAVAVIDVEKRKVKGYIPTGWGPTRVALTDADHKLIILSARGFGAGPNGGKGFVKPPQGTYIGDIQLGTVQLVNVPSEDTLRVWTRQVLQNTFREIEVTDDGKNPCPPAFNVRKSPIKHVFYITKENRTFDEVLGQMKNAVVDSSLARFAERSFMIVRPGKDSFIGNVTPNHYKLARRWAFSDNFYCDSDASIHGHHWMTGQMVNEYVEANSAAEGSERLFSKAPGRRFPKTTGGVDPEDYNEIGGMWENMARRGKTFYNFGESNEFADAYEAWNDTLFGSANPVVYPLQKILLDRTSHNYAGFNTNIPDQFRVEQFEKEFTGKWINGKETMPDFIGMQLPNDHGSDVRPEDGYPMRASFMTDNDLALGRIISFLSKTKYWKNMLVVVTEDDPQGGVDHVDAHRSILMMAGPYVKKGYVSHRHANFGSVLKTMYAILGVPPVNQFDASASILDDFFTGTPDLSPYEWEQTDDRIFDPKKAMKKYGRDFDWRKIKQAAKMDKESEQRKDHYRRQEK